MNGRCLSFTADQLPNISKKKVTYVWRRFTSLAGTQTASPPRPGLPLDLTSIVRLTSTKVVRSKSVAEEKQRHCAQKHSIRSKSNVHFFPHLLSLGAALTVLENNGLWKPRTSTSSPFTPSIAIICLPISAVSFEIENLGMIHGNPGEPPAIGDLGSCGNRWVPCSEILGAAAPRSFLSTKRFPVSSFLCCAWG